MPSITTPLKVGRITLKLRAVLAPLTRIRAEPKTRVPSAIAVEYYGQRAADGVLLISEATFISPETVAMHTAPGIWTAEQVAGWKKVTDAVHAKGGFIFCQLWHQGRVAHSSFSEDEQVKGTGYMVGRSASDIALTSKPEQTFDGSDVPFTKPIPLTLEDIGRLRQDYIKAAHNAIEAGFDGVELHGAHGYLIDQFLNEDTNMRTDKYGGSAENRSRLLDEVLGDICAAVGNDRVAVRLSPHVNDPETAFYGVTGADYENTYRVAFQTASRHNLAYLLVTEQRWVTMNRAPVSEAVSYSMQHLPLANSLMYKKYYTSGPIIGSSGFTPTSAPAAIEDGSYDATAFGRWYLANPDLPFRILNGLPLNKYNRATFYVPGAAEGYTDYPTFEQVCEQLGVDAADYIAPADTDAEMKAAFEHKFDELVALSEGKLAYPLITVKSLGINAVNQGVKKAAPAPEAAPAATE